MSTEHQRRVWRVRGLRRYWEKKDMERPAGLPWATARENYRVMSQWLADARKGREADGRSLDFWDSSETIAYREDCVKVALDRLWKAQEELRDPGTPQH